MKNIYSKYFLDIDTDLKRINNVFKKYLFSDLFVAVYCINICRNNRSALESQLTLNLGLKTCDRNGTQPIKNYSEFKNFFKRIKPILDIDYMDDPITEDFGDIKFKFENIVYNVILGNGYTSVYSQLYFLKPLAAMTSSFDDVTKVLKYNSDIIDYFKESNLSDGKTSRRFVLPKNLLFKVTRKFFENLDFNLTNEVFKITESKEGYIEKEHFIKYNRKAYPLYNTSIIIDLFDKLYKLLSDEERVKLADLGIANILSEISKLDQGEFPLLYYPVNLYDKTICKLPYTFLWRTSNSTTIIGINKDRLKSEKELKEELNKILKLAENDNLKIVESIKRSDKGYLGITVTKHSKIKFIIHDSFTNLCEERFLLKEKEDNNALECSALDLAYMLLFMKNIDEIEEYINYNEQKDYDQMIGFGGDSSRFLMWKSFDYMFARGAVKFGMIGIGINSSDEYVIDYFKKTLNNFPWQNNDKFLISNPFSWNIEIEKDGIYRFSNKIRRTFLGYVKYLKNNGVCFFAHNIEFFDSEDIEKYKEMIPLIDDISMRKMKTCNDFFDEISMTGNNFIEILFMPNKYADKVGLNNNKNRKYVNSDCLIDSKCINIRYRVNYERLYKDILNAEDRTIENEYFKELFAPLNYYFPEIYSKLCVFLDKTNTERKEVEVVQIAIDYIYDPSHRFFPEDLKYFLQAKKDVAIICLNNNIEPGDYYGKKANHVIRGMQKELISYFETEVTKYDQLDLHCKLLEIYSNSSYIINIHRKRFDSITDVTDEILYDVQNRIIEQREMERRNVRTIQYLIETNLFLERGSDLIIDNKELNKLLALSNWLIVLNDSADVCYFTSEETHITVDSEYVVENIVDLIIEDDYNKRVYSKNNYALANDEKDIKYITKLKEVFELEAGISLLGLFEFCNYLQNHFIEYENIKICPNVYKIDKKKTVKNFEKLINSFDEGEHYSSDQIEEIIDFLTINPKYLKKIKNKEDFYLPINERENRDNRFDVKPIFKVKEELIFSPITIKNVYDMWFNGIQNFMMPYEIGLSKTTMELLKWKKRYEEKMVFDIKNIFLEKGVSFVRTNIDLYTIDRKEKYPIELGDYDVIAIDDIKKKIWIIESKHLNKVGNFFEMFSQQRNFFLEHKYDEKFQRRIDFMFLNYKRVLKSFGFIDSTGYTIQPIMIFNKVFISRYKKVNFPIISIMELEERII